MRHDSERERDKKVRLIGVWERIWSWDTFDNEGYGLDYASFCMLWIKWSKSISPILLIPSFPWPLCKQNYRAYMCLSVTIHIVDLVKPHRSGTNLTSNCAFVLIEREGGGLHVKCWDVAMIVMEHTLFWWWRDRLYAWSRGLQMVTTVYVLSWWRRNGLYAWSCGVKLVATVHVITG